MMLVYSRPFDVSSDLLCPRGSIGVAWCASWTTLHHCGAQWAGCIPRLIRLRSILNFVEVLSSLRLDLFDSLVATIMIHGRRLKRRYRLGSAITPPSYTTAFDGTANILYNMLKRKASSSGIRSELLQKPPARPRMQNYQALVAELKTFNAPVSNKADMMSVCCSQDLNSDGLEEDLDSDDLLERAERHSIDYGHGQRHVLKLPMPRLVVDVDEWLGVSTLKR
jgi:hypothetical protein